MARLIWTEPAQLDLETVAEYLAIDDPRAVSRYVQKVFNRVQRLEVYPQSGKRPAELLHTLYREIVVAPCRIFYRAESGSGYVLHVMRAERLLRLYLLDRRDQG